MDADERGRLIARYRDGYRAFDKALDDGWTPRQIVHHLADAEIEGATMIRRLLAETDAEIAHARGRK